MTYIITNFLSNHSVNLPSHWKITVLSQMVPYMVFHICMLCYNDHDVISDFIVMVNSMSILRMSSLLICVCFL